MTPVWFLMFDGSSPDGRGAGTYIGRTESAKVAWDHYVRCRDNPYSTGYVLRITDSQCERFQDRHSQGEESGR